VRLPVIGGIVDDDVADALAGALERGLILLTCGLSGNVVRVLVPLVVSDEELARGPDILAEALLDGARTIGSPR
jgi:4-aminobutyrate aminotransferase-like enzyme